MSLYANVTQMKTMLHNLDRWLVKAGEHAKSKGFDPNVLLQSRLAPDQYPLIRQIQAACDAAKFAAARVAGKAPPSHPDDETTYEQARARIAKVTDYLASFSANDFEGGETRKVPLSFLPGKGMVGEKYLAQMASPNFYFHVTTAYAILRHNGVDLGKRDYIGDGLELIDV
ncbi:MAG: DUF1993 domain-containing protein [Deltaproteobacteria bacterium]|nr:DUF1993 domain-containing protein [Deltaproteobacteria bacterium]